jgi:urease beta subunit
MSNNVNSSSKWYPGQIWVSEKNYDSLTDRNTTNLIVKNSGDRPIQVGSHFHFFEVNKVLDFDRKHAYGMRLCIPAGTAVRFEPGQTYEVSLIALGGKRVCFGFNGLVNGNLDDEKNKNNAFLAAKKKGFKGI